MIAKVEITTNTQPQTELEKSILRVFNGVATKLNEVIDTLNRLEESVQGVVNNSIADGGRIQLLQEQIHALKTRPENVRLPYMQNKRLRKALGIAQSALVKLANDAYDFDEHIYIDKILNRIERITKGGNNE